MEGADINVCVRIRPLLDYEHRAGFFGMVFASNPKVLSISVTVTPFGIWLSVIVSNRLLTVSLYQLI